jgi:hypothetical protein
LGKSRRSICHANSTSWPGLLQQTNPLTSYLGKAEALLDASHPWQDAARAARADLMARIASPKQRSEADFKRLLTHTLGDLKIKYQDAYLAAHERSRLGANDDKPTIGGPPSRRRKRVVQVSSLERSGICATHMFDDCEGVGGCCVSAPSDMAVWAHQNKRLLIEDGDRRIIDADRR